MAKARRRAVYGRWVLLDAQENPKIIENCFILIEDDRVVSLTPERPPMADEYIEMNQAFVMPGFLNLHNHCFSSPLFRGLAEDLSSEIFGGNLIYSFLMPMGALAVEILDKSEMQVVYEMAILDLLKHGSTTVVDVWRLNQEVFFEAAKKLGIRAYGSPYLFSTPDLGISSDGRPTYGIRGDSNTDLQKVKELFRKYDEGPKGRIRVGLAPHGVDTCDPELLQNIRKIGNDLGCHITIHLAQSQPEVDLIRQRYGKTPVEHLRDLDFLGPDVLAAHCVYASDNDLKILRDCGATLVTCPQPFARSGVAARFDRFKASGVRLAVGTDGYVMDIIMELRIAGIIAKTTSGKRDAVTARQLFAAATKEGAAALNRPDLGIIMPGAKADLVIVDMQKPHLQPVTDPLRTLIWNGSGGDISLVMVDGEILVRDGKYARLDEGLMISQASKAIQKVREKALDSGLLKVSIGTK